MTKYNAVRTEVDGITFASKKESVRYSELKMLLKAGKIQNLELQPAFEILIERKKICTYKADFRYWEKTSEELRGERIHKTWQQVVEDVKGMKTPVYRLKKKLVEAQYGIEIREV